MDDSHPPKSTPLKLPSRIQDQSLLGYMRQHVDLLDALVASGIKLNGLVLAMKSAGFTDCRHGVFENALHRARHHSRRSPARAPVTLDVIAHGTPPPTAPMPARSPFFTPEQLRKTSGFNYKGTADLDIQTLV